MRPHHAVAGLRRPVLPVRLAWRVVAATVTAAAAVAGPAAGPQALAQGSQASGKLSVVIESVTPRWAQRGHRVTVTGVVRNGTGVPQGGLSVELRSRAIPLGNEDDLSLYADGAYPVDIPEGLPAPLPGTIAPGASVRWRATLNPAAVGMTTFGVYPLAADVVDSADVLEAADRTFLPYWPGGPASRPKRLSIGWIWPIVSQPEQAACPALLSNALASSLASGGRLGGLLAAGRSYSTAAQLTWAIDPAVVRSAETMSHPYSVGGRADCTGAKAMPANAAARRWLTGLTGAISGQHVFLTPYADVDVAALSHHGLDADLRSAFAESRAAGSEILHLPGSTETMAWPPGGLADAGVLGSLAVSGIRTVVLDSTVMPPKGQVPSYTPSAQTSAASGVGSSLRVLLADHTMSQILAAPAGGPGSAFATEQRFLAQTAMIVAELPATSRSLVVAPPRLWDPAPGLASTLLSETVTAPWLRPRSLAAMAAQAHPAGQVPRRAPPAHHVSPSELSKAYLGRVASLSARIRLLASTFSPSDPRYLAAAVAALESADWPGGRAQSAAARGNLLGQVQHFVSGQARKIGIIDYGQKTLGGSSGRVPVSIFNGLHTAVRVKLRAQVPADGRLSIGSFDSRVSISAGKTTTVSLPVHAAAVGVTEVTLTLVSQGGAALPWTTVQLPVRATRFGTLALVILIVALALFVLASSVRALRRSRRDGGQHDGGAGNPPGPAAEAGSVSTGEDLANDDPPEDPDEYAEARGRASR